jgi:hypothetical protein
MRARSALVVICLVGVGLGTTAPSAGAAQHLMKVREVHAGSLLDANVDFVELQMYQLAQTQLNGHKLIVYTAGGSTNECPINANVTNGNNQATILFATSQAQTALSTTADFTIPPILSGSGGAVCFDDIDCVSWGSFPGGATDRDGGPGTPEPGGIPVGDSIDRRIDVGGSPTALEAADDTNNSSNDFEPEDPSPDPNSPVNLGTLTCSQTPGGTDTDPPTSKITAPKHKTAITVGEARNFQGTAKDQGGSISKVEVALRQKRKDGCRWWNGSSFVAGGCTARLFVMATGDKKWSYTVSKNLRRTGARIRHYTLYSRATDAAENMEAEFVPQANLVRFEVFKGPITCEPGC